MISRLTGFESYSDGVVYIMVVLWMSMGVVFGIVWYGDINMQTSSTICVQQ